MVSISDTGIKICDDLPNILTSGFCISVIEKNRYSCQMEFGTKEVAFRYDV